MDKKKKQSAAPEVEETPESVAEIEETEEGLDPAAMELADAKDRYLRLAAEYDNFRKRTQREREAMFNDIKADVLTPFLAVIDNFERAAAAPTEDTAYAQGVEMIAKQLLELLNKQGVTEIDTSDGQFDPNFHNAIMHIEDDAFGQNHIVEVFQKGYRLGDKVIRHSVVKVAN